MCSGTVTAVLLTPETGDAVRKGFGNGTRNAERQMMEGKREADDEPITTGLIPTTPGLGGMPGEREFVLAGEISVGVVEVQDV
jgi:hypothetical protein